jgi:hypothetical protein
MMVTLVREFRQLAPDTTNTGHITTVATTTATIVTRTNTDGTDTITGTIMIETTTGIEAYEIDTFCPCAGLRRIDFSIM